MVLSHNTELCESGCSVEHAMRTRNRPISLLSLRAFEAAARRLSFTEAARELYVTQAAISRHVRTLESELGKPLFRRLHRKVQLTPSGQRFASALAAAFHQIQQAIETARGVAKPLRVSVEPAFASRWLMPRLRSFTRTHPDIELQLEASETMRALGADTDVAIRFLSEPVRRRGRTGRKLFSVECVPVTAADARLSAMAGDDSAVVKRVLLHDDDGRSWRAWFKAARIGGFERAKHHYLSDYSLALEAARQGNGVALGTKAFLEADFAAAGLQPIGRTRVTPGSYWLLETRDRATARLRDAFIRWLEEQLASSAAHAN